MTRQLRFIDGADISLWREACKLRPGEVSVKGQHLCKLHKTHDGACLCICGTRFGQAVTA